MHILALVSLAVTASLPIVGGAALDFDFGPTIFAVVNNDLTAKNHYGSPLPPWVHGSKPGWYFGPHPGAYPGVPCLNSVSAFSVLFLPFSKSINFGRTFATGSSTSLALCTAHLNTHPTLLPLLPTILRLRNIQARLRSLQARVPPLLRRFRAQLRAQLPPMDTLRRSRTSPLPYKLMIS